MKKTIATLSLLAGGLTAQAGTFSVDASALYVMPDIETYSSDLTGGLFDFYNILPNAVNDFVGADIFGTPGPSDEFDDTYGLSIKFNYEMDNSGFSFGPELIYFSADSNSSVTGASFVGSDLIGGGFDFDGTPFDSGFGSDEEMEFYGVMLNLFYDFDFDSFSLFVGGGVGYLWIDHSYSLDLVGFSQPIFELSDVGDDDAVFAYQFILGGKWNFTENFAAFLNYRYIGMDDPSFGYGVSGPVFDIQYVPDYEPSVDAQALELGLTFTF